MFFLNCSEVYKPVIKHLKSKYPVIKKQGTYYMLDVFTDWLHNKYPCKKLINGLMDQINLNRDSFDKAVENSGISKYVTTEKIDYENYDSVCLAAKFYGTDLENFVELMTCIIDKDLIKTKLKKWKVKHLYEKVIYLAESVVLLTIGKLFFYLRMGSIINTIQISSVDSITSLIIQKMISGTVLTYDKLQKDLSEDFLYWQKKKYKHQNSSNYTLEEQIMESIQKIINYYSSVIPAFFPVNEETVIDDLEIFPEIKFDDFYWKDYSFDEICDIVKDPYILFVMNRFYKKNINLTSQLKPKIIPIYKDVLVLEI